MTKKKQLYSIYENVLFPGYVRVIGGEKYVKCRNIKKLPFVFWPNGKPCVAVNSWLVSVSEKSTGSTAGTYAAHISHLVRFCFLRKISFHDLTDAFICEFAEELVEERMGSAPKYFARHNNQVRQIIGTSIGFLIWYQDAILGGGGAKLIGTLVESPNIIVREKRTHRKVYYEHSSMPPKEALQSDKIPMPDELVEKILDEILRRREASDACAGESEIAKAKSKYIYERRIFVIWIMKRTGLRPEELHEIPVAGNSSVFNDLCIRIPTKKRRRDTPPIRSFPITARDARHFSRYMRAREEFIVFLRGIDGRSTADGAVLLNEHGGGVRKESISKDFERLSKGAGILDCKSCFSMFRHRFITREIVVHLKEFMSSGGTRELMTDGVMRSIAKRISAKTGHGSPESIWAYFDIAWDQIGVWGSTDAALKAIDTIEGIKDELVSAKHDVAVGGIHDMKELSERISRLERELASIKWPAHQGYS